ncbi:MAG: polymer-forming cytoskeletal protein [Verrucomicrobiales bacterium]
MRDGKAVQRLVSKARIARPGEPHPAAQPPAAKTKPAPPKRPEPRKRNFLQRLIFPSRPPRQVLCFACGTSFKTVGEAQSSQCPSCGGYVSLANFDIEETWNRRIETRGDVVIRKTGYVSTAIRCHNITILGKASGDIDCSGTLTIRSSGKIAGTLRCRELHITKGARVEFLHPVNAESASIDGRVRGQLSCSGPVTLHKRSRFQGLIQTSNLIRNPGAEHKGTVEIINQTQT